MVTTLFCDVVGFTALAEDADPEDVDALLSGYGAAARTAIESHGGIVEKFIGDAVVGVFGVPMAHEDDPERAVGAALRLVEALKGVTRPDGSPLQVRVGVNTGEALVRLDVTPGSGIGFLTGDAVNTAARLQAAAPPMGVVVGEITRALSARAVDYREMQPVIAKGKREPVLAWLATALRRRTAELDRETLTPLVGREVELAYLQALSAKCLSTRAPQFALIVGEPGIGKSRLVAELRALVTSGRAKVAWLEGRCPPFGEGVTFRALEDIARQYLGLSEDDDAGGIDERLDPLLPAGPDREWVRQRLRALLGCEAPAASREENFAAWLRFLEDQTAAAPAALVFQDLHWADEALLAFLEHLATHLTDVPVLILATARPELFEKYPAFAAHAPRVNRVALEPLADVEMRHLVVSLLGDGPGEAVLETIMARAAGNPFYAEESARLLGDQAAAALDAIQGGRAPAPYVDASTLLPLAVHALLAARLDALPPDHKRVLCDAAVAGDRFHPSMVAGIGEQRDHEVESALTALLARQLIRRVRHDRPEAEQEYAFQHALVRDVAYGQLPRGVRARKHAAIAEWLETRSSARAAVHADDAEIIAEHYAAALEFATASGDDDLARRLAEPAVRSLTAAGERAAILDAAAADHYFTRALGLVPEREPTRARLLESWGTVLHRLGRYAEASEVLAEAAEGLLALGDKRKAAWGMLWRASTLSEMCDERYGDLIRQACELLKDDGPSWERAWGLMASGLVFWGDGRPEEGVEVISQAIAMNAEAGVAEPVDNIGHRGAVRCESGDMGGLEDYARARELAEHQGLGPDLVLLTVNFANTILWTRGPQASLTEIQEGRDLAIRRGLEGHLRKLRALETEHLLLAGRWDDTLREAADLAPRLEEFDAVWDLVLVRAAQATCLARQGRASEAAEASAWLLRVGRHSRMTFIAACCLLASAEVAYGNGESDVAHDLLREFDAHPESAGFADKVAPRLPEMVRLALALDDRRLAERLGRRINTALPLDACASESLAAHLAEARGEHVVAAGRFAGVASRWHDFGVPYEEGRALLGRGRCLTALRRVPEVAPVAQRAQEIFVCLAAEPALAEARRLLVPRVAAD